MVVIVADVGAIVDGTVTTATKRKGGRPRKPRVLAARLKDNPNVLELFVSGDTLQTARIIGMGKQPTTVQFVGYCREFIGILLYLRELEGQPKSKALAALYDGLFTSLNSRLESIVLSAPAVRLEIQGMSKSRLQMPV